MGVYKKGILTRLFILSIVVFGIMNCEENNPSDSTGTNITIPDVSLYNNWLFTNYQISTDGVNYEEYGVDEKIITIDSTGLLKFYYNRSLFVKIEDYTFEEYGNDSIAFISDPNKAGHMRHYRISCDSLIMDYQLQDDYYRTIYKQYIDQLPPANWPDSIIEY